MRRARNNQSMSPRMYEQTRYTTARMNLLTVIAFTLINILMTLFGSMSYFCFSATLPYVLVLFGMINTGRMPDEYYDGAVFEPFGDWYFYIMLAIAAVLIVFYAVCWLLSKKHFAWLIAALCGMLIDTAAFFIFYGFAVTMFLDILFHGWVIYYLIIGIIAAGKLRNMPPDEPSAVGVGASSSGADRDARYAPTTGTAADGYETTGEQGPMRDCAVSDDEGLFSYFEGDIVGEPPLDSSQGEESE